MTATGSAPTERAPITIERTFDAGIEDVWEMWTTRDGLESWWGPAGFVSTVRALELRVGGRFEIVMRAVDPEIIAFLEQAGQGAESVERGTYTEVSPQTRLGFVEKFDHAPEVEPYDVSCSVVFSTVADGTHMVLRSTGMHDARWTELATAGWNGSLDKLARVLAR